MKGVIFFFEDKVMNMYSGRWDGDVRIWHDTMVMYNFDKLIEIDISTDQRGIFHDKKRTNHMFDYFLTLEEAEEKYKDMTFVYMEDPRTLRLNNMWDESVSLDTFQHPADNVIYVIGADSGQTNICYGRQGKTFVHVEAPNPQAIWGLIVLALIGDDRRRKGLK